MSVKRILIKVRDLEYGWVEGRYRLEDCDLERHWLANIISDVVGALRKSKHVVNLCKVHYVKCLPFCREVNRFCSRAGQ